MRVISNRLSRVDAERSSNMMPALRRRGNAENKETRRMKIVTLNPSITNMVPCPRRIPPFKLEIKLFQPPNLASRNYKAASYPWGSKFPDQSDYIRVGALSPFYNWFSATTARGAQCPLCNRLWHYNAVINKRRLLTAVKKVPYSEITSPRARVISSVV